ncbi:MAG: GAF domain-containing sensor histidine kinase [Ktedonobacteraceae bacterium]
MPQLQLKATATEKLTRPYLAKLHRQNYIATAITILIVIFGLFWELYKLGGQEKTIYFADSMYGVAAWIGSFWACRTAYRARFGPLRLEPRHQLAWLVIGIALFANGIGGFYYTYLEWKGQLNPVPSPADLCFTIFYFLTFVGLLLMPTAEKFRRPRLRTGLDATITMLCILGISWYFVIGPIFMTSKDIPTLLVAVSYPFWDVLLILAVLLLIFQRTEPVLHSSLLICGLGIISQIIADTGYALSIPFGTYTTGTPYIDTFWFCGFLLIGLAAPYQYAAIARRVYHEQRLSGPEANGTENLVLPRDEKSLQRNRIAQNLLIYISLILLLTLTLISEIRDQNNVFLVALTAIVGLLVTARYLLVSNENEALLQRRDQRREMAERLRVISAQLAEELELDRLITRIIAFATTSLGFDAIVLMLFEEYDHPLDAMSSLLIRAASSTSTEMISWRFQGDQVPYNAALAGKQIEIYWSANTLNLPADFHEWQQQEHLLRTLFVPLAYQGKNQGSLGFSSRASRPFSDTDLYLAKAFTEEAATAIEHTHLYQAAREHELFSQAMANVAARLNSAAATGTSVGAEILQLICNEGANALQADYALLYVTSTEGKLLPVATFVSEREQPLNSHEWPYIHKSEYEAKALWSLQPVLIQIDDQLSSGKIPAVSRKLEALTSSPAQQNAAGIHPIRVHTGGLRGKGNPMLREVLLGRKVQTAILAPLIAGSRPAGLLILARSLQGGTQQKKAFAMADLPQAQDFAEQAAIAFTNAQLYQQLLNAHRHLQELDQLKDQFMITASHELRTPLTAVHGYLELMSEYGERISHQQQEFLQKARRGCDELVLLLNNVTDASRLEIEAGLRPLHLEKVDVEEAIRGVIDLIEPQIMQEYREVHVYTPHKLFVKADPVRLRQVLLNLSVNALKYSEAGTPITFTARTVFDKTPGVLFSITDKGKGIKPQDHARLFQRFVRLESDINSIVRGSGLGLYISRRLIEAMDGNIWIESSGIAGAGSTFHFRLPVG